MYLVTDVTGSIGRAVVAELANQSVPVRYLNAVGSPPFLVDAANVEAVTVDSNDAASLDRVLEGVEAAFLATPVAPQMAEAHLRFIGAAKTAGVKRLVQLSGVGANAGMCCARVLRWFGQAEAKAEMSGLGLTRLRPTTLLQNLLEFAPSIAQQGLIAGPFRSTKWTWVDARDVGAVAATALKDDSHAGRTYTVTGRESLNYQETAERLSRVLGKPIRFTDITANEARGWLQAKGMSPIMIEAKLELWDACASNLINVAPTDIVKEVTGREPRSMEDFARDYKGQLLQL
jgi:uncharacterized protein YbjT (DUF2867 family)